MTYAIRRRSPNAKDPRAKELWVWQTGKGEFAYTEDINQAFKISSQMAAMGIAQAAKREDDMDGVSYMVVEL